jgi:hypothetical protein
MIGAGALPPRLCLEDPIVIYTDLEALAIAATQMNPRDAESVAALSDLIRVYFDALHNPPPGVIGVGAITYAQDCLVAAQLEGVA